MKEQLTKALELSQVKELASTFADDKQEAIQQETELQGGFDSLMSQKTKVINTLTTQHNDQSAILTQINQEVGENENAEATAQGTLTNEQTYLSGISQQESDLTAMYHQRQQDRTDEKNAVQQATTMLMQEAPALLQMQRKLNHRNAAGNALLQTDRAGAGNECPACRKAAAFLSRKAKQVHSELLATAAATTGAADTLGPVVQQLHDLIGHLHDQATAEKAHKDWCDSELHETNTKKYKHDSLIEKLKADIEDTDAVLGEKQQQVEDTAEAIKELDGGFGEVTTMREKAKADYDAEHTDYVAAITALNQAIDLLGDFYRDQALVQMKVRAVKQVDVPGMSARSDAPTQDSLTGGYVRKGGSHVVTTIKTTRQEFEAGKHDLELFETKQVEDYAVDKSTYANNRNGLVEAGNRLAAEVQTAQSLMAQHKDDLSSNEKESASAATYLAQLGGSCAALVEHFDDRVKMRADEEQAITDTINVLSSA